MVLKHEGIKGIYKGYSASFIRESVYSSLRMGLYEPFKVMLGETDPKHTPLWLKFCAGSLSGFVGSVIGNPTDVLKVRMQAWEGRPQNIMWHTKTIYKDQGWNGFYRGVQASVLRATLLTAT